MITIIGFVAITLAIAGFGIYSMRGSNKKLKEYKDSLKKRRKAERITKTGHNKQTQDSAISQEQKMQQMMLRLSELIAPMQQSEIEQPSTEHQVEIEKSRFKGFVAGGSVPKGTKSPSSPKLSEGYAKTSLREQIESEDKGYTAVYAGSGSLAPFAPKPHFDNHITILEYSRDGSLIIRSGESAYYVAGQGDLRPSFRGVKEVAVFGGKPSGQKPSG